MLLLILFYLIPFTLEKAYLDDGDNLLTGMINILCFTAVIL